MHSCVRFVLNTHVTVSLCLVLICFTAELVWLSIKGAGLPAVPPAVDPFLAKFYVMSIIRPENVL